MDIDELQSVQSRERQTDSLQQLRESFYREASEYIQQLRDARDEAAQRADDPWDDPEVNRLSDEINTAEQAVEAIYDRRTGKIVKQASLAAAGMPAEEDGLTAEESELFEALVGEIGSHRKHVLDLIAGDVSPDAEPPQQSSSEPASTETSSGSVESDPAPPPDELSSAADEGVSAADVMGGDGPTGADEQPPPEPPESEPDRPSSNEDVTPPADDTGPEAADSDSRESTESVSDSGESSGVDRETVKITADVGEILGVDQREYDLGRDDIVQLPAANAGPLVDRDAAERID
jgi:DNA replication factor GINS